MTVIYIDRVFALNLALDYMLLLICARLAGTPLRRLRFLLCAAGGALYAAAVFLPGLRGAERAGFPSACGACDEPCGLLVRGAALAADRAVFPRQRGRSRDCCLPSGLRSAHRGSSSGGCIMPASAGRCCWGRHWE